MTASEPQPAIASIRALQIRLLKIVAALAVAGVSCIWVADSLALPTLNPIDRVGYPALIGGCGLAFVLLCWRPATYAIATWLSIGTFALYGSVYMQSIVYNYQPSVGLYSVAAFVQWAPLIYLTLFLFYERRWARPVSVLFYLSFAVPLLVRTGLNPSAAIDQELFPFFLQMLSCHPLYIATLIWIQRLQDAFINAQTQLIVVQQVAATDALTGLANRRAAAARLQNLLAREGDERVPVAVCLVDLDRFKAVNDTYGHDVGDRVLVAAAQVLQDICRPDDTVGRWGGEEFIVILPATAHEQAIQLAETWCQRIASQPVPDVGRITASLGLAFSEPEDSVTSLTKRADLALYQAKRLGRNQVRVTLPAGSEAAANERSLGSGAGLRQH